MQKKKKNEDLQMAESRWIIFFAAKDGEENYCVFY